jgi:hypothetical protein
MTHGTIVRPIRGRQRLLLVAAGVAAVLVAAAVGLGLMAR